MWKLPWTPPKNFTLFFFYFDSFPYHEDRHVVGVAGVLEPAEGADVVPGVDGRGEGAATEGSSGVSRTVRAEVVDVDVPAGQRLHEVKIVWNSQNFPPYAN